MPFVSFSLRLSSQVLTAFAVGIIATWLSPLLLVLSCWDSTLDPRSREDQKLLLGQFLVLSENWYDTAFANELNGPLIKNPERLIKTRPLKVYLYREILSGSHPNLELVSEFNVQNFMPELILHKKFYGTFQKFVGDIKIYKITP